MPEGCTLVALRVVSPATAMGFGFRPRPASGGSGLGETAYGTSLDARAPMRLGSTDQEIPEQELRPRVRVAGLPWLGVPPQQDRVFRDSGCGARGGLFLHGAREEALVLDLPESFGRGREASWSARGAARGPGRACARPGRALQIERHRAFGD